jgi:hypothetical protein
MAESPDEPFAWPEFDSIEATIRGAGRAALAARHAAEEFAGSAVLNIRKHPLRAVGMAMMAGVVVGSVTGFACGWLARK